MIYAGGEKKLSRAVGLKRWRGRGLEWGGGGGQWELLYSSNKTLEYEIK